MRIFTISALLTGAMSMASVAQGSVIINGDFETGTFEGWTVNYAPSGSLLFVGRPPGATEAAWFGAIGHFNDSLSQTFATVPGETYEISFWLSHGRTNTSNEFGAFWNDAPLLFLHNAPRFAGTTYDFLATATGETTTLRFAGRELVSYYELDDVNVAPLAPAAIAPPVMTPEPVTLLLVATGAAALVRQRRRHQRKTSVPS